MPTPGSAHGERLSEDDVRRTAGTVFQALRESGVAVWTWDPANDDFWCPDLGHLLAHHEHEPPSTLEAFLSLIHEGDRPVLRAAFTESEEERPFHRELRVAPSVEPAQHIVCRGRFVRNEQSEGVRALGTCWLAPPRKHEEEELLLVRAALESAAHAVMVTDAEGTIEWVNPAFTELTGYEAQEVIGKTPRILKSGSHDAKFYRQLWATLRRGLVWQGRIVNRRKDGASYSEYMSVSPVWGATGQISHFVSIKHDITREMELEEQLHAAQRMESVGRLASGIAHDFNNVLTIISGNAELAFLDLSDEDGDSRTCLEDIRAASRRGARLTKQLLAFSRQQILKPEVVDVNELIQSTEKMLRHVIGEDIHPRTHLEWNLRPARVDRGQLEQILMNLAVNARDAMPDGGLLTFATENAEVYETQADGKFKVRSGRYVKLTVSDTGVGMDEETRSRIFEPFFTTKEKGKGTGLGLSTVYGIVKQSGGYIWVYSDTGMGASFKIYLPCADQDVHPSADVVLSSLLDDKEAHETVLLAEDDDRVRHVTQQILEQAGYVVLPCRSGEEAAKVVEAHPRSIDLLLTDLVMPGMNGRELEERLTRTRPGLAVLYMSGYADDAIVRHGVLEPGTRFLEKPFTRQALLAQVRLALRSREELP